MNVPDDLTLRRFLQGDLPADAAATIEEFLETNPEAAGTLERLAVEDSLTTALRGRAAETAVPPEAEALARHLEALAADFTRTAGGADASDSTGERTADDLTAFLAPARGPNEIGRLGDFRILRILGRGGMGVVFEAQDVKLDRHVAVKAMLPRVAADPAAKARFLREAQAAAAVEHDHVVHIHLISEDNGVPFLVMPFLKGESLDDRLKRDGKLPIAEVMRIGREVAEGLAAAHERGLVHRDIKPANLWLEGSRGRIKILDFGLARPQTPSVSGAEITQSGAVIGTPAYMSPEQGRGQPVDFRTDLFSLGGLLYRACTGQMPFQGTDAASILMSLAADTPVDPLTLNPAVPPGLGTIIRRLLEKDPAKRPQSAQEVARLLAPTVEPLPAEAESPRSDFAFDGDETEEIPQAMPVAKPARKRSRIGRRVGVAVAMLLVGVTLYFAPTIVRVATNKGELVIEVDDPDIEVVVKGADAEVHDKSKGRTYVLKAGDGEVEFIDPETGARALTKTFRIVRGGRDRVTATMGEVVAARPKPKISPAPGAGDQPPPKELFPGELLAYETFDDPKECKLPTLKTAGKHVRCQDGAYVLELFNAKAGDTEGLTIAGPVQDVAIATRLRATNVHANLAFRRRLGDSRLSYLLFQIHPNGTWALCRVRWKLQEGELTFSDQKVLAQDENVDPDLAAGKWINVKVHSVGPVTEVWAGPRMNAKVTEPDTPDDRLPLDASGVDLGPSMDEPGRGRLDIDYAAVWKLTPASGPMQWTGDKPPPKDLFPGKLLAYHTFDDPKTCPFPLVDTPTKKTRCEGGAFVTEVPKAAAGDVHGETLIGPVRDPGIVARIRGAVNCNPYISFRLRASNVRVSCLGLAVYPNGTWDVSRMSEELIKGEWKTAASKILYSSDRADPDLVAGKWYTLRIKSIGQETEVWVGPKGYAKITEPDNPDDRLPLDPRGAEVGGQSPAAGPYQMEIDYAAAWDLSPASDPKSWTGDQPPPKDLFLSELLAYETFERPNAAWPPKDIPKGVLCEVKDGVLRTEMPARPEPRQMSHWFGKAAVDVGFSVRLQTTEANAFASFGFRQNAKQVGWLTLTVFANGGWVLHRNTADSAPGYPNRKEVAIAESTQVDPALAAGRWVNLVGSAVGDRYEVRANGKRLCAGPVGLLAGASPADIDEALEVGFQSINEKLARLEIAHAAVWKLNATATPPSPADRAAAAWVLSIGDGNHTSITVKENGVERLTRAMPAGPFELTGVTLQHNPKVTDDGLAILKDCKNLTLLQLGYTSVGDAGLAHFKGCTKLKALFLSGGERTTDTGVANFKDCKDLTTLSLHAITVSDVGLACFSHCKKLEALGLRSCNLKNVRLDHFQGCNDLKFLDLADTGVNPAELVHFKECKQLKHLDLDGSQANDTQLGYFKDCKDLSLLNLKNTKISDMGLEPFQECKNLVSLILVKTAVSPGAIDKFHAKLPNCWIEYDGGVMGPKAAGDRDANTLGPDPAFPILAGHTDRVRQIRFLPDGKKAVSVAWDGTCRLWDLTSGTEERQFKGDSDKGLMNTVAVSPDGKTVAAGDSAHKIYLWNLQTGKPGPVLRTPMVPTSGALWFTADGKRLLAGMISGEIFAFDLPAGKDPKITKPLTEPIVGLVPLPGGTELLVHGKSEAVVWDVEKGAVVRRLNKMAGWVEQMAPFADGKRVATIARDGRVRILSLVNGEEQGKFLAHSDRAVHGTCIFVLPGDRRLLTTGDDRTVCVWDAVTLKKLDMQKTDTLATGQAALSSDGRRLLTGAGWRLHSTTEIDKDWRLRLWRVPADPIPKK